jgi:23S rRNA (cytosine1962-C5)-methyltransferase
MLDCKVFLKAGKEEPVRRFHPWIFSGAIAGIDGKPADGDVAGVFDRKGNMLGVGHFHHGSISVRILHFGDTDIRQPAFWEQKLRLAVALRRQAGLPSAQTDCYRLVHGEGDGLSGLIIDVYGDTAVMQCHSIGMHRQRELIAQAVRTVLGDSVRAVYDKSAEALPPNYAAAIHNGYLWTVCTTSEDSNIVNENGVRFKVDWGTGQKTGFFLDQRDNRRLLGELVGGKTVLNTFCYTGGFSAYALKAGAALVHSVDVSARAVELTLENMALNAPFSGVHEAYAEDTLRFLKASDRQYDVVVVDPPAYAKSLDKRHNAVQGYKRLNAEALTKVSPGGLLFTFSCSQVVDRQLFYNTIVAAALESGRRASVLHHLTQGADHPVSLFHPEGSYLKGLVLFVE